MAVANGASFQEAARQANRHSRQAVAHLVHRYNQEGLASIYGHHGGGPAIQYGLPQQERILREFARTPEREQDGTATWSLSTLQKALRKAPEGLPKVSTYVILQTLYKAGYTWQKSRSWCQTGSAQRVRHALWPPVPGLDDQDKRPRDSPPAFSAV